MNETTPIRIIEAEAEEVTNKKIDLYIPIVRYKGGNYWSTHGCVYTCEADASHYNTDLIAEMRIIHVTVPFAKETP